MTGRRLARDVASIAAIGDGLTVGGEGSLEFVGTIDAAHRGRLAAAIAPAHGTARPLSWTRRRRPGDDRARVGTVRDSLGEFFRGEKPSQSRAGRHIGRVFRLEKTVPDRPTVEPVKPEIDIEALLLWTFHIRRADVVIERGVGLDDPEKIASGIPALKVSADGCFRVGEGMALGTRVDCAGRPSFALDPDADRTDEAVMALDAVRKGLVLEHVRAGARPDWLEGAKPRYAPLRRFNGKPVIVYDRTGKRALYCPIRWIVDEARIDYARRIYVLWWSGLTHLVRALDGKLDRFMATGPASPEAPWNRPWNRLDGCVQGL